MQFVDGNASHHVDGQKRLTFIITPLEIFMSTSH
jgi:hypothetical protein